MQIQVERRLLLVENNAEQKAVFFKPYMMLYTCGPHDTY